MEVQTEGLRRSGRHLIALVAVILGVLMALRPASAQQAQTPTLNEILQRLEDNLNHYNADVPSLFCDEHVVSRMSPPHQEKATDSTFRLKRGLNPDGTIALLESREVKEVDGFPAAGQVLSGPAIVSGAFSGGFAVVSLSQQACMRYMVHTGKLGDPYVVSFVTLPSAERPLNCLLRDDASGSVTIDPATTQVKQVEIIAMHHTIIPSILRGKTDKGAARPPIVGPWIVSIGYAPVVLDGHSFWLPSTITSNAWDAKFSLDRASWEFKAEYSNYHKLEVTSHVVPDSVVSIP